MTTQERATEILALWLERNKKMLDMPGYREKIHDDLYDISRFASDNEIPFDQTAYWDMLDEWDVKNGWKPSQDC